jgi:predicted transcriptional regulator of viral defense system
VILRTQHSSVSDWLESLLSKGVIAFSSIQLQEAFPDLSDIAIKRSLDRLSKKQKVISIYKCYYLIIPPQYAGKGMLPPPIFIDGFMKHLDRPYYVGLLNASAYHGSAHQQPQEFFVVTSTPALRATVRNGVRVNYISKKSVNEELIESRKTESGYLKISNPALTAIDLVQFVKRSGGLNRVATVLNELAEAIKPEMFSPLLLNEASTYSIQRLGYLLEHTLNQKELATALYEESVKARLLFYRVPLKASAPDKGFPADEKWKVAVNLKIEVAE